jgi:hypothetical protein
MLNCAQPLVKPPDPVPANRHHRRALRKFSKNPARHPLHPRVLHGSARASHVDEDFHEKSLDGRALKIARQPITITDRKRASR